METQIHKKLWRELMGDARYAKIREIIVQQFVNMSGADVKAVEDALWGINPVATYSLDGDIAVIMPQSRMVNFFKEINVMKAEYYNNTLCIEGGWLYKDAKILTETNYKQLKHRGIIKIVRRACKNTPELVSYHSLPTKVKEVIKERYGDITK